MRILGVRHRRTCCGVGHVGARRRAKRGACDTRENSRVARTRVAPPNRIDVTRAQSVPHLLQPLSSNRVVDQGHCGKPLCLRCNATRGAYEFVALVFMLVNMDCARDSYRRARFKKSPTVSRAAGLSTTRTTWETTRVVEAAFQGAGQKPEGLPLRCRLHWRNDGDTDK